MTYDPSNYDLSNMDQLNRTEPPYLATYGLAKAPFSPQHEDSFLFLNSSLEEQLELLKHYTQYGNLLLIVKGERGIGKSSLKYRFVDTAQEEWQICEIQADTMMDSSRLLREVATGFGITEPPHDAKVLYEVLISQLEYLNKENFEPILIIDDAHELPQDALQSLLYLAEHHSGPETALRIILFCEPQIDTMLEDPAIHALKERVTHSIDLHPLNEIQTAEYLRHRLAVAGFYGNSPFTPSLIHKIFTASAGIPEKINEYAHQNLIDDSEPSNEEKIEIETIEDVVQATSFFTLRNIVLMSIAAILIISVLIFQGNINQLFEPVETVTEQTQEQPVAIANNKIETSEETVVEIPAEAKTQPEAILNQGMSSSEKLNDKEATQIAEQQAINKVEKEKLSSKNILQLSSVNPSPVPTSKQRQIISISGKGFHKRQKVKVSWTGNEKILSENQVNVTSDTYMNLILSVGVKTDTWSVSVSDPELNIVSNTISFNVIADKEDNIKTTRTQKAEKKNGVYDQTWIKQQNQKHFTLQLLGSFNKTTHSNYIKKYSLKEDAVIFRRKIKGKDWFTLIYGSYPTKLDAQAAAKKLPKGMAKPWARSFASITPTLSKITSAAKIKNKISVSNIPENKEGWLWSQDPQHYTLQLTAGTNKKAIEAFIKRHKLQGKAAVFNYPRDGKNWYILIYGSFNGYSKAKQAIAQLPTAIQKTRPWARTFSAIHAELN